MKILLANTLFPPVSRGGGTEVVIQRILGSLASEGHALTLITTQPSKPKIGLWDEKLESGVRVYRFRPRNLYYYTDGARQKVAQKLLWHALDIENPWAARVLKSILMLEKPDLVHGHNLKGMSYTLPRVCAHLGIPYVHTLHNYQLLHPYGTFTSADQPPYFRPKLLAKWYQTWNRKMFRHVTGVISPSALPLRLHKQVGFFSNALEKIIPSPVEAASPPSRKESDNVRLVYFGAIEKVKGIESLIASIEKLPSTGWSLDIYGNGSQEQNLRERTKKYHNVFWRDYTPNTSILNAYDALVYPSVCWETQGLAMAEALAQGTPVIAADIGSIPETIQHGVNGLLYPSGDIEKLAGVLLAVISNPKSIAMMRHAALESSRRYSKATFASDLLNFYKKCSPTKLI